MPDEALLRAVQQRVDVDDTIPEPGKQAIIALIGNKPTFAFANNQGIVLQFNIFDMPDNEPDLKKAATLLMGTSVIVASERNVPLSGIEVVFYTAKKEL